MDKSVMSHLVFGFYLAVLGVVLVIVLTSL
jgi:hypothetical protein